jgi:hypothetical protein
MHRRGRRRAQTSQNLDSLLDTMANVVGILVALLAVVQLTVGDAMDRIRVFDSDEGRELALEQRELEQQLAALGPASLADARVLEQLRKGVRALFADPDAARVRDDAASAATTAAGRAAEVRRLERRKREQRRQLSALRVRLDERDRAVDEAGIELRLPDPRPAPPRADRVVYLVRYGRVLDPRLDALELQIAETIRDWTQQGQTITGHGARALSEHVAELDLGNDRMRWQIDDQLGRPVPRLEWRDRKTGDDLEGLRRPEAGFRGELAQLHPERHYLSFWVWGDSFESYLAARRIAESAGFSVGWRAVPTPQPLRFALGPKKRLPAAPVD